MSDKVKILVLDDEPNITLLAQSLLSMYGFDVTVSNDPFEALKIVEKEAFRLILSDVMMPGLTGLEFIEKARETPNIIDENVPNAYKEQIKKITEKKKKQVEVKFIINVKSFADDGVSKIKELFDLSDENIKVTYISAGKFKLKLIANDFKEGKQKIQKMFEEMEAKAKGFNTEIDYKEEKN